MKKIFVVVADTVTGADGISVVQPLGRRVAQVAHVVSKVRVEMLKHALTGIIKGLGSRVSSKAGILPSIIKMPKIVFQHITAITLAIFEPYTTIILSCRDSKELIHVQQLLDRSLFHPDHESFEDYDQPDYGDVNLHVMTAIATWPVEPDQVLGITDYLPLLYK
jgi:hypothetical protein